MASPQAGADRGRHCVSPLFERAAATPARMGCTAAGIGGCDSPAVRKRIGFARRPRFPKLAERAAAFVLDHDLVPHGGGGPDRRRYVVPRTELGLGVALEGLSESEQTIRPRGTILRRNGAASLRVHQRFAGGGLLDCCLLYTSDAADE